MFMPSQRDRVRERLLDRARDDTRITGAAVTGSASRNAEDRWSDIDLFFGIADGTLLETVLGDWTDSVYGEFGALHHFDVRSGSAAYRVFLLPDCLEVDLAFTPENEFGARGPAFQVVFGEAVEPRVIASAKPEGAVGLAWHHVLHARICIERGKPRQAERWISGVRDQTLVLACLRLGHPADYSKGADDVPPEVGAALEAALVRELNSEELSRALRAAVTGLLRELYETDRRVADRLEAPLRELAAIT
ncbi:MAG: hypothetical protein H0V25_01520 [Solirubrobacterales bacterium]|nr:hypothetical protein [Solirubrobacterales bacterium]